MKSKPRTFAISDIHGCGKTFRKLVKKKLELTPEDKLYILGDLIDRGPNNKLVFDFIFELLEKDFQITCLLGNHEEMFLSCVDKPERTPVWAKKNGGDTTLKDFGVSEPSEIDKDYINFIRSFQYYQELENFLLVHAGFNFKKKDIFEDKEAMLWIRGYKTKLKKTGGKRIIHGHTPIGIKAIKKQIKKKAKRINIDNGCAYPDKSMHALVALNLDTLEIIRKKNIE